MRPYLAIALGLGLAVAVILIPRATLFEGQARDACEDRGQAYVGLHNGAGRYADPVPDGARCERADHGVDEIDVRFFAGNGTANALLGWLYRLACLLLPIGTGLVIWGRSLRA